ncbi:MAG: FAD-binding oxidoreductase [Planctomycetaceae bacterium]|nr:FAD-binding oxidoreductase [Planctomycetales bacterium]MCB9940233.1 FAD-binding oxidoreductase [Planctomycetaceae bacterium]
MSTVSDTLPISDTTTPTDAVELAEVVRGCYESETAIYPIGGGTSLDYGLPAKRNGIGLSLAQLSTVIDYPARDLTITVGSGITMQTLAETLAKERQRLPIDVPKASQATLGGVIATNFNGPRRFGQGTVRDHVIGIRAVDGRGLSFKGGGRVVKNVAGYDFCKLLTGSLGTLGVITELTLKLKPIPDSFAIVVCSPSDLNHAEQLLAALVNSDTTPSAVELLAGPAWGANKHLAGDSSSSNALFLAVALEGTEPEVAFMIKQLGTEWRHEGVRSHQALEGQAARDLFADMQEFPSAGESPLVLRANMVPSGTTRFIDAIQTLDKNCSIQSHAGNGIVLAKFSEFPSAGLARTLVGKLQAVAASARGNVVVLSNPGGSEMTHQSVWGAIDAPFELMTAVKREFDPKNILNPDRFVYVS